MISPVTAVIIHWRQPEACIETVGRFLAEPEVGRVIVVDNGSSPEVLESIDAGISSFADAELIRCGSNTGFGPAANRGIERWLESSEAGEWVALAPHDAIPGEGVFGQILDAVQHTPDIGLVSADVGDGMRPRVDHVFGPILEPALGESGPEAVDYPHGTLMMARRECLTEIGLFDERYFAYDEEADLGLRAIAAGWRTVLMRGARVYNPHVNTPSPLVEYLKERNTILLQRVHFGRRKAAMRFVLTVAQLVHGLVRPAARIEGWSTRGRLYAIRDVLRRRWGAPPETLVP